MRARTAATALSFILLIAACGGDDGSPSEVAGADGGDRATTDDGSDAATGPMSVGSPCDHVSAEQVGELLGLAGEFVLDDGGGADIDASDINGIYCQYEHVLDPEEDWKKLVVNLSVFTAGTNGALGGGNDLFPDSAADLGSHQTAVDFPDATLAYSSGTNSSVSLDVVFGTSFGLKASIGVTDQSALDISQHEGALRELTELVVAGIRG